MLTFHPSPRCLSACLLRDLCCAASEEGPRGMGNGLMKKRIEGALTTGIFVGSNTGFSSWAGVKEVMEGLPNLRGAALDYNKLRNPIPSSFMKLRVWTTLRTLDLSFNKLKCACVLGRLGVCTPSKEKKALVGSSTLEYPLEVLTLSGNALRQLPPLLLELFPKLLRLVCRDNARALDVDGGLVRCIGASSSLASVDLGCSSIRKFVLIDSSVGAKDGGINAETEWGCRETPYPSLRELLLDGNEMEGTFTLVAQPEGKKEVLPQFPLLRTISLMSQRRQLEHVDPLTYVVAPSLNALNLEGNKQQEDIMEELRRASEYKHWCCQHRAAVDKQLKSTGKATLM